MRLTSRRPPLRRSKALLAGLAATLLSAGLVSTGAPAEAAQAHYRQTPITSWRTNGNGYATVVVGNIAYIGGSFSQVTSPDGQTTIARDNLAAFDTRTGDLVRGFRADTNGTVRTLAADSERLYVGGEFGQVKGKSRNHLAAVDLDSGAVLSWKANANDSVLALALGGGDLFVGGSFTQVKGLVRRRLAAVRVDDGSLTGFAPKTSIVVQALATDRDGDRIYAGGHDPLPPGQRQKYLAEFTGSGRLVKRAWDVKTAVLALDLSPNRKRLAAGTGGNAAAWLDTATGRRLWTQKCNGDAQAIRIISDSVVSGFHDGCNGDSGVDLTINRASDGHRDADFTPVFNQFPGVRGIDGSLSSLVVAGTMTSVSGVRVGGFAIFPAS